MIVEEIGIGKQPKGGLAAAAAAEKHRLAGADQRIAIACANQLAGVEPERTAIYVDRHEALIAPQESPGVRRHGGRKPANHRIVNEQLWVHHAALDHLAPPFRQHDQ